MGKLNKIAHSVIKEFERKHCGFDHDNRDDLVKSQWQSLTKSIIYVLYRWFIALFFTVIVIESMWPKDNDKLNFWLYFIYLTNWGILMCMLTNLLAAILVTIWYFQPLYADKSISMNNFALIYWGMHIITLNISLVITIIYWSILYNASEDSLNATNVLTHAFNSICMLLDFWIVAHPLRLLHIFLPVAFGLVFSLFSYIYQSCGGINKKGKNYIYHVLDWRHPSDAMLTILGVLLLNSFIYMLLFMIYKTRLFLHRRLVESSSILPITKSQKGPHDAMEQSKTIGIQHSPSGISMVLGNFAGCENQNFSISSENIEKQ